MPKQIVGPIQMVLSVAVLVVYFSMPAHRRNRIAPALFITLIAVGVGAWFFSH